MPGQVVKRGPWNILWARHLAAMKFELCRDPLRLQSSDSRGSVKVFVFFLFLTTKSNFYDWKFKEFCCRQQIKILFENEHLDQSSKVKVVSLIRWLTKEAAFNQSLDFHTKRLAKKMLIFIAAFFKVCRLTTLTRYVFEGRLKKQYLIVSTVGRFWSNFLNKAGSKRKLVAT